ncbi:uncharacterized protein LOC144443678 [Glandiceps talaboti]
MLSEDNRRQEKPTMSIQNEIRKFTQLRAGPQTRLVQIELILWSSPGAFKGNYHGNAPGLKASFDKFDVDGNGKIDSKELGNVLRSLGQNPSEADVEELIKKLDTDGSGTVEFEEFITVLTPIVKVPQCKEDVREAFKVFDVDGSGYITANEFRHVMYTLLGRPLSDERLEKRMTMTDKDGDGKIQYEGLKASFDKFDVDGNGKIDSKELGNVLRSLGQNPSEADVEELIKKLDTDGSGTVEFEEFITVLTPIVKVPQCKEDVREAFKVFDVDGSGYITANEFRHVMYTLLGRPLSDERLEKRMTMTDKDGDGKIQYEGPQTRLVQIELILWSSPGAFKGNYHGNAPVRLIVDARILFIGLKRAFGKFDVDGNGKIDSKELGNVLKSLGQNPSESDVEELIKKFDTDESGTVEVEEFVKLMAPMVKFPKCEEDVRASFKVFDVDGSGYITADELRHVKAILGSSLSDEEVEAKMTKMDKDGDGKIQYEEFLQLFNSSFLSQVKKD